MPRWSSNTGRKLLNFLSQHYLIIFFFTAISYLSYFWLNVIKKNSAGDLLVRQANIWADWALHFTIGATFAEQSLWHANSPLLVNTSLTYPPAADWFSAVLNTKLGLPFFASFIIPSWIFSILIVIGLYLFVKLLTKSSKVSLTASLLFLLNGGLGFVYFFQDLVSSPNLCQTLRFPPQEYTDLPSKGIHFMSFLTSMIYPQRGFTLGFPLALAAVGIVLYVLILRQVTETKKRLALLLPAAVLLGITPLVHPHSALAAGIILSSWFVIFCWDNRQKIRQQKLSFKPLQTWLTVGGVALLMALPFSKQLYFSTISTSSFLQFNPGFMAGLTNYSWPVYWLINWGVIPLLAVIGFYLTWKKQRQLAKLSLPFIVLFVLTNLWQFQPWIWDNIKLLAWSAVGISLLAAVALQHLWRKQTFLWQSLALGLFVISILAGTLEQIRNIRFSHHRYLMYTAEELALAEWAKNNTSKSGTWLTGDHHNNWAYNLTGRQTMIAYPGWLTSHGLEDVYFSRNHDRNIMLNHPDSTPELFKKYNVAYASIGPNELANWPTNIEVFRRNFTVIKETKHYTIFAIE